MVYKTRFCPSPTGLMHLGNLRTALFNVLLAKSLAQHQPAIFLLRIEDTDLIRSQLEFTQQLMTDLRWLNLDWQEGPKQEYDQYFQSQRHEIYQKYYQILLDNQQAYWCFCTEIELTIARKNQLHAGLPPRYPGTCRHLSPAQKEAKIAKGLKPALRFHVPEGEMVQFEDFIQGSKRFQSEDVGDFIIQKADGSASFMFCNALDDALMQVTHVLRGEDHLTNTPRQLLVLQALGLKAPLYGHMPLILGFDGKPLSKRNGSQSIVDLRAQGYFPLAIINYLSRLGHHFESQALSSLEELGQHFSLNHMGRAPAHFDIAQLHHWQKETVLQLTPAQLGEWLAPWVEKWVPLEKMEIFTQTVKQNIVLPQDALFWAKQLLTDEYSWTEEAMISIQQAGIAFLQTFELVVREYEDDYQKVQPVLAERTQKKGKSLFMPLRAIISGTCAGPELAKIFKLMGKELLLKRIHNAQHWLQKESIHVTNL